MLRSHGLRVAAVVVVLALCVGAGSAGADPAKVRGGLEVEDLGSPIQRREVWKSDVYTDAEGAYHFLAQVLAFNGFADDAPSQFLDINLTTGKVQSFQPGKVNGMGNVWAHENGKVYVAGTRPSTLIELDPLTGKGRVAGLLTKDFYHAVHSIDAAPDGRMAFGTYTRRAITYDPKTDEIIDYGPMDGTGNTYVYTIAYDGRYIYCGMSRDWYLVIFDTQTRTHTTYREVKGGVSRGKDGHILFANTKVCKDGRVLTDAEAAEARKTPVKASRNSAFRTVVAEQKYPYEFDVSDLDPTNWNGGHVGLKWRRKGAEAWQSAMYEGVDVQPNTPAVMAPMEDGRLIGMGSHYGPIFIFDPKTRKSELVGMSPLSINAILVKKDAVHFVGYSSAWYIWDRTKPWTMRGKRTRYVKGAEANPRNITGAGKWPAYVVEAFDGAIYSAGNYGRHLTGGEVVYYDPKTAKRVSWRKEFEPYNITSLCVMSGGETLACTAVLRETKAPTLFVIDAEKRVIARKTELKLDSGAPGIIMPSGLHAVLGVATKSVKDEKTGEAAHVTFVYRLDVETGKVLSQKQMPGRAFAGPRGSDFGGVDREIAIGPDGCGWFFIDKTLVRITPDGAIEKVKAMPHGARILWVGDDLYFYNGGRQWYGGFASIWRMANVFGRK